MLFIKAQELVVADHFDPYSRVGDTLYFNRQGYDAVQVSKKINKNEYEHSFYVLRNDRSGFKVLQKRTDNLYVHIPGYRNYSHYYDDEASFGYQDLYAYKSIETRKKRIKIPTDWDPVEQVDTFSYKPLAIKPEMDTMEIKTYIFPDFAPVVDSIAALLNYEEDQEYDFRFTVNRQGKATCHIVASDMCSNYNLLRIGQAGLQDLEKFLSNLEWPVLKVHSRVFPYQLSYHVSYYSVVNYWINRQVKDHFSQSVKVFKEQDSLFALVDSFNKKTVVFLVQMKKPYTKVEESIYPGIIHFTDSYRYDVNNDGLTDLVLDSTKNMFNNKEFFVGYLPNYKDPDEYIVYHGTYGFGAYFFSDLAYEHSLGNHFYYRTSWEKSGEEGAGLYYMENGYEIEVIYYHKYVGKQTKILNQIKNRRISYSFKVINNKKLSLYTHSPEKAFAIKTEIVKLLNDLIEHPEKLPDFMSSKKDK